MWVACHTWMPQGFQSTLEANSPQGGGCCFGLRCPCWVARLCMLAVCTSRRVAFLHSLLPFESAVAMWCLETWEHCFSVVLQPLENVSLCSCTWAGLAPGPALYPPPRPKSSDAQVACIKSSLHSPLCNLRHTRVLIIPVTIYVLHKQLLWS